MGSNYEWNFKGHFWNFTHNFEPIHRKICRLLSSIVACDLRYLWIRTSKALVGQPPGPQEQYIGLDIGLVPKRQQAIKLIMTQFSDVYMRYYKVKPLKWYRMFLNCVAAKDATWYNKRTYMYKVLSIFQNDMKCHRSHTIDIRCSHIYCTCFFKNKYCYYIYIYCLCAIAISTCSNHAKYPWWSHQMETFSALLAICAGNSQVPGEFPAQRPVTRSQFLWSASE